MEWQFAVTEKTIKQHLRAQVDTKGTGLYRQKLLQRWMMTAILSVGTFIALFALARKAPLFADRTHTIASVSFLAFVLFWEVLYWCITPGALVRTQMRAMRFTKRLYKLVGPQCVTLRQGVYRHEGTSLYGGTNESGAKSSWEKRLSEMTCAEARQGGILLLFSDNTSDFLPAEAFSATQTVPFCLERLTNAAQAVRGQAVTNTAQPGGTLGSFGAESGCAFQADEQGASLTFTLPQEQLGVVMRECNVDWWRRGAFWRLQWRNLLLLFAAVEFLTLVLGMMLTGGMQRSGMLMFLVGPLCMVALVGLSYCFVGLQVQRRTKKGHFDTLSGVQTLTLRGDTVCVVRERGAVTLPSAVFYDIYETAHCLYLLQKEPLGILPIPKTAFADAGQQQAFVDFVKSRLATKR